MRIALVSDSHIRDGRPLLPSELVEALREADLILHAGDIADVTGLEAFAAIGPEVIAVAGNLDVKGLVAELPEFRLVETAVGTIALMHILPRVSGGDRGAVELFLGRAERPLAVVHGHTHCPEVRRVPIARGRTAWIVNPGTVTRDRGWGRSLAWLEATGDEPPRARIEKLR